MPRHPGNILASRILRVIRVRPIGSSNRERNIPVRTEFELVIGIQLELHQATAA
ncbi:hypothetical protein KY290_028750 [Solanum tuberosum]|uniref:Uncharacterized protein n=1 Tax=Solanum tuberosum TaxID=4113 RepID=A0ABQ7UK02_SOLTU|nr:hypothetical protein KY290_028750 [Solanum tuberosum]